MTPPILHNCSNLQNLCCAIQVPETRLSISWRVHVRLLLVLYIVYHDDKLLLETRQHDDVIKWKHFLRYWPFMRGIHRSPVNSPHKVKWRGALVSSLICVWINGWVNNREAGDLRRHCGHYDVIVMMKGMCRTHNSKPCTQYIPWNGHKCKTENVAMGAAWLESKTHHIVVC